MGKKIFFVIVVLIVVGICIKILIDNNNMPSDLLFEQTFVKTSEYFEDMSEPTVTIVKNLEDIDAYLNLYNDSQLKLELEKYNEEFFSKKSLAIIAIQESSGSNTNTLKSLKIVDKKLEYLVERHEPEVGTCDMAMNYILVQVDKASIANVNNVSTIVIKTKDNEYTIINFTQQLIKTHEYFGTSEDIAKILTEVKDVNEYLKIYNDNELKTELEKYKDEFFSTNALVVIAIQESSGSNSNTLKSLKVVNNRLEYFIESYQPEIGTCDMAMNYIIAEVSKLQIVNITDNSFFVGEKFENKETSISFTQELLKTYEYFESMKDTAVNLIIKKADIEKVTNQFSDKDLKNKLAEFTDEFFKTKALIVIAIQESSGSNSNTLKSLKVVDGKLEYLVERHEPEVGTFDMAMNYILVQVDKKDVANVKEFVIK